MKSLPRTQQTRFKREIHETLKFTQKRIQVANFESQGFISEWLRQDVHLLKAHASNSIQQRQLNLRAWHCERVVRLDLVKLTNATLADGLFEVWVVLCHEVEEVVRAQFILAAKEIVDSSEGQNALRLNHEGRHDILIAIADDKKRKNHDLKENLERQVITKKIVLDF